MKVIFLHIPKTAGQSLHAALVDAFGEEAICPARVNNQLARMPLGDLDRFTVFSGHLDWSRFDGVVGPKFVFTVLRKPLDRILSFYFYLREQGAGLSPEERTQPDKQGITAAYELDPNEFFVAGPPHLRDFLDDHFDNFYTYFFAGRSYRARSALLKQIEVGSLTRSDVVRMAKENLARLDGVYSFDHLGEAFRAVQALVRNTEMDERNYWANINDKIAKRDRMAELIGLGADARTIERLHTYCEMDDEIWRVYAEKTGGGTEEDGPSNVDPAIAAIQE